MGSSRLSRSASLRDCMPPSHLLTDAFRAAPTRILLVNGEKSYSGTDLLARFETISHALAGCSGSCVICESSAPEDVLTCLCLPALIGVSVLFVPEYLSREVSALTETVGASALIRSGTVTTVDRINETQGPRDEVLLLTSGTSGRPKVVRHKWQTLFARVRLPKVEDERVWLLTYLPTSFAGIQVLLTAAVAANTVVRASPVHRETLAIGARQGITHLSCTPTFLRGLIAAGAHGTMLPRIRQVTMGGEIADQRTLDAAHSHFPAARISHIYAATETGALFSVSDGLAGFPKSWLQNGVEDVRLKVVDDVLHVNSPRAMIAYAGSSNDRASGWIDTGDLVRVIEDRVLFMGRRDRRINVGGSKTLPEEVERAILEVPGVADAVVTGVPSPLSGQMVLAEVVPTEAGDTEELRQRIFAHIRGCLANHQIPRILRFRTDVPLSPSGKKSTTTQSLL
jgi:acyl-coenzyme A synthetase/AMP-(fatty) acid ligase